MIRFWSFSVTWYGKFGRCCNHCLVLARYLLHIYSISFIREINGMKMVKLCWHVKDCVFHFTMVDEVLDVVLVIYDIYYFMANGLYEKLMSSRLFKPWREHVTWLVYFGIWGERPLLWLCDIDGGWKYEIYYCPKVFFK